MLAYRRAMKVSAIVVLTAAGLPPAAGAQQPPTLTAEGSAQVKPEPRNRRDNASIKKAVEAAEAEAQPKAIAAARAHAAELAAAAGVTLGRLVGIADAPLAGYPFIYTPQYGTFGNGRFCGQVRNTRTVVRNGVRRRVATKGKHKVCRVPPQVTASVSMTFSITVP